MLTQRNVILKRIFELGQLYLCFNLNKTIKQKLREKKLSLWGRNRKVSSIS